MRDTPKVHARPGRRVDSSCVTIGRFRAAPQLAAAHLNQPSGAGPALSKPGAVWLSGLSPLSATDAD
jgi:hypothetical protein